MSKSAFPLDGLIYIRGEPVTLGKNVVVLELFATWCPHCREATPHLTELYNKYMDQGVQLVGVTDESEDTVRAWVEKMGAKLGYSVAIDPQGICDKWRMEFGAEGVPHAFVIDKEQKVVYSGHPMEASFVTAIDGALAEEQTKSSSSSGTTGSWDAHDKHSTSKFHSSNVQPGTSHHKHKSEEGKIPNIKGMKRADLENLSCHVLKVALLQENVDLTGLLEKSDLIQCAIDKGICSS